MASNKLEHTPGYCEHTRDPGRDPEDSSEIRGGGGYVYKVWRLASPDHFTNSPKASRNITILFSFPPSMPVNAFPGFSGACGGGGGREGGDLAGC